MLETSDYLSSIPQRTLEDRVLERLREAIINRLFEPGSQINLTQVAETLDVSRGTIRAALSKLEEDGLVINIPHKGTFVTTIDRKTVMDVYGVREALESFAVLHAVKSCDEKDIEVLRKIYSDMQEASNAGEMQEMIRHDLSLHGFFVERSDNAVLQQIWASLEVRMRRLLVYRYFSVPYLQEMADSHTQLVEQTEKGNAEQASKIMCHHIQEARDDILARWEESK